MSKTLKILLIFFIIFSFAFTCNYVQATTDDVVSGSEEIDNDEDTNSNVVSENTSSRKLFISIKHFNRNYSL